MFTEKDLVRIAKRENNNKRKYLVVNCLQAKHVPAVPGKTFELFDELADKVREKFQGEKLLLVGFAETATAIGSRLAVKLDSWYMQTTREDIGEVEYLYFSESHSHATEQKVVKDDLDKIIGYVDRIVFVEDEVTTGNTIMKIVDIIRDTYGADITFGVASILNGMDEDSLKHYEDKCIDVVYLVKTDHSKYEEVAESFEDDGEYCSYREEEVYEEPDFVELEGYVNGRRLVKGSDYDKACESLWEGIKSQEIVRSGESVLVVGTEEFMYPAIYVAYKAEELGADVKCHSTTRSPIAVCKDEKYPLHRRYELRSLYDVDRKTFIYDVNKYDKVIVVTDSFGGSTAADLVRALSNYNKDNIYLFRWCD